MTGLQRVRLLSGLYLLLLRFDLVSRGVTCDLEDSGGQMRLRVYCPGAAPAAQEPLDVVSLAFAGGEWWCCWPEGMVICPVVPLTGAAEAIISELGLGPDDPGTGASVVGMTASSKLRQARLSIARPPTPAGGPARQAPMTGQISPGPEVPVGKPA
jgi:hypothetical protein